MAQYRIGTLESETAFNEKGVKTAEPLVAAASLPPRATAAVPPEMPAQVPSPAIARDSLPMPADPGPATARAREAAMFDRAEPSPLASSEPQCAAPDCPPGDGGPTRSDAEDPNPSGIEDSTIVAQSDTALDGTSAGERAAEIAHLQALIDGLTQKVEWRIDQRHKR